MTGDLYVQSVIDHVPHGLALRDQIGMELRGHIAERVDRGQPIDDVLRQLGDPLTLAESYLAAVPLKSAGVLRRLAAKLIDAVTVFAVAVAIGVTLWAVLPVEASYFVPPLCFLGAVLTFVAYTVIAEYRVGRTFGKRLMGIQVVRESGARISLGQSALRQLPFIGQFFFIDALFALFTERRQRAFELLTKTRAIALLICIGMLTPTVSAAQTNRIAVGAPLGHLVDIGGRKLHLHCIGAGAPTVVLESGASSFAVDWALVQPDVARTNRVCSYDRAGIGWSDGGDPERADRVVRDLHSLLDAAGEQPPYVLVGASRGGIYTRIYQRRYPAEVVGMVQVDPSHEGGLFTMANGRAVTIASLTPDELLATVPQGRPPHPPTRNPQTGAPFDRLPPNLYSVRLELERRLIARVANADITRELVVDVVQGEHAALSELLQASRASGHPLGDLPIVVLTRGLDSGQEQRERHVSLAAQSTRGRHEVVPGSHHEIHLSHPAAVVNAIQEVLTGSHRP